MAQLRMHKALRIYIMFCDQRPAESRAAAFSGLLPNLQFPLQPVRPTPLLMLHRVSNLYHPFPVRYYTPAPYLLCTQRVDSYLQVGLRIPINLLVLGYCLGQTSVVAKGASECSAGRGEGKRAFRERSFIKLFTSRSPRHRLEGESQTNPASFPTCYSTIPS